MILSCSPGTFSSALLLASPSTRAVVMLTPAYPSSCPPRVATISHMKTAFSRSAISWK